MSIKDLASRLKFPLSVKTLALLAVCLAPTHAFAAQTINTNSTTSCTAQGGTLTGGNLIVDFDNGTFGTESGEPNQSPSVDPYPAQISGGIFVNFYDIDYGNYAFVANPVMPRNAFQHANITDPVYGDTGRFFASDPNANTPTLNFTITNVTPNENYEISFWAANSEPNGTPNRVNAVLNNITSYTTGPLIAFPAALEWRRHAFVFNAGNRTTVELQMASTETGPSGRDFYVDNVEMNACALAGGSISGRIYGDSNTNNTYDAGVDGTLAAITVQLWDTQGDGDSSNDIFVSSTESGAGGLYQFSNLAPISTYELRVDTTDPDLPGGASPGTSTTLSAAVSAGNTTTGQDFGFDLSQALLQADKAVALFDPSSSGVYAIPGNDVIYTISITNVGGGPVDNNAVFLVDELPDEVTFYNGDIDGPGGATSDPVLFSQSGAGLSFTYGTDVRFAGSGPKPANFGACNYVPASGYDTNVAYICFNPKGQMNAGAPNPNFSLSFRTAIN